MLYNWATGHSWELLEVTHMFNSCWENLPFTKCVNVKKKMSHLSEITLSVDKTLRAWWMVNQVWACHNQTSWPKMFIITFDLHIINLKPEKSFASCRQYIPEIHVAIIFQSHKFKGENDKPTSDTKTQDLHLQILCMPLDFPFLLLHHTSSLPGSVVQPKKDQAHTCNWIF